MGGGSGTLNDSHFTTHCTGAYTGERLIGLLRDYQKAENVIPCIGTRCGGCVAYDLKIADHLGVDELRVWARRCGNGRTAARTYPIVFPG